MAKEDLNVKPTRREFTTILSIGAGMVLLNGCGRNKQEETTAVVRLADDLVSSSVIDLADAIRKRQVSCEEVMLAYLERIESINPNLNAIVLARPDSALEEARQRDSELADGVEVGPLHGVPMTLKDSIDTANLVTTGGTLGRKDFIPKEDATVAARLRNAGAVLMGKTNTPEFTMSFETDNLVYGRTGNPYNTALSPGGSSGGAAAAIASAMCPFDIGSDTGGSIRQPSHFSGIAGIKPTTGRVPRTGHIVDFHGVHQARTQLGPMARRVKDLYPILQIISGPDMRDPFVYPVPLKDPGEVRIDGLRMAWHSDNGLFTPTPETQETVMAAVRALEGVGLAATETVPSAVTKAGDQIWAYGCDEYDGHAWMDRLLESAGTVETHKFVSWTRDRTQTVSSGEFTAKIERLDRFRSEMLIFMEDFDLMITPVAAFPALPYGESDSLDNLMGFSYTNIHNLTGWPGAVVRCGTSPEGLPIGVQVIARPWAEHVALAVAQHLEEVFGGWQMPKELV